MSKAETSTRTPLTDVQSNEALWKVIGRFDTYIGTTNAKAAFLIAFNIFVVGGIVLKWQDIKNSFGGHGQAFGLVVLLLLGVLGGSLYSLWYTFRAINPYLKSPKDPGQYHSNIFFEDVAAHPTHESYLKAVGTWDSLNLTKDLAYQAYALAQGVSGKFRDLKKATGAIIWYQLPLLLLVLAIFICTITSDILSQIAK